MRLAEGPGYALTPRAVRRLDDAAARIYRTRLEDWDGTWHLLVTTLPTERSRRDRLRAGLTFLGYAQLDDATWIGPRWSEEVDLLLETETACAPSGSSPATTATRWGWSGGRGTSRGSRAPTAGGSPMPSGSWVTRRSTPSDEQAFAARSRLVHEWRKFLFLDPGLPRELLPVPWAGEEAAHFFDAESGRLQAAACPLRRPVPVQRRPEHRRP